MLRARRPSLFVALALPLLALGGCHFYFEDDDDDNIGDPPLDDFCQFDSDCPEGCYCDGYICVESEFEVDCFSDAECATGFFCADGWCVPTEPTCLSSAECTLGDVCDVDSGDCRPALDCAEHTDKASCEADPVNQCEAVTRGENCTHPDGGDCEIDPAPCTCESYVFAACATAT